MSRVVVTLNDMPRTDRLRWPLLRARIHALVAEYPGAIIHIAVPGGEVIAGHVPG